MTAVPKLRLTRLMREAEERAGKPLGEALPEILNIRGLRGTAEFFGCSNATINYWMLLLGIKHRFIAIPKGYRLMLIPEDFRLPDIEICEQVAHDD